jgi:hypothetical protein
LARRLPGIISHLLLEGEEPGEPGPLAELIIKSSDAEEVQALAARYETDAAYRAQLNAVWAEALAPLEEAEAVPPDLTPGERLPALVEVDPEAMGDQIRRQVRSSLYEMAAKRAAEENVKLVVFGHTHDAGLEELPGGRVYLNSGTWTWRADFSGAGKDTWRDLFEHPERFTEDRRLSYVRIDYDAAGEPQGQLLAYQPAPEPGPDDGHPQPTSLWERVWAWLRDCWERIVFVSS